MSEFRGQNMQGVAVRKLPPLRHHTNGKYERSMAFNCMQQSLRQYCYADPEIPFRILVESHFLQHPNAQFQFSITRLTASRSYITKHFADGSFPFEFLRNRILHFGCLGDRMQAKHCLLAQSTTVFHSHTLSRS